MVMFILFIVLALLSVLSQQHTSCGSGCDPACYHEFSKYDANTFLANGKRSTPRECCFESHCEGMARCKTEQHRAYIASRHAASCGPNKVFSITGWCYKHYGTYTCTDPCQALPDVGRCLNGGTCVSKGTDWHFQCQPGFCDSCQALDGVDRCLNGGTCVPKGTDWYCQCLPGFEGQICSININYCAKLNCNSTTSTGCIPAIQENDYRCACKAGWTGKHCDIDIDECVSSPCRNGGQCKDYVDRFDCTCVPGYTGVLCEIDIDECASSPCQNNANCTHYINYYKCDCPNRFYGVNCDTNICHPTPADVVFVLDSSVSMTEVQFRQQLQFVTNLTREVKVGPNAFQISVITFSTDARIEFFLNENQDNESLVSAIKKIDYRPGTTNTHKALELVKQVFSASHGIERRINGTIANRFVYLITDGLSLLREETRKTARNIKDTLGVTILVIGIGHGVSHKELIDVATDPSKVYSISNFNSLYTLLKRLVHFSCNECIHSAASDVVILLDNSVHMTPYQFDFALDAITYLLDRMKLGPNDTRVSVTTFADEVKKVFDFDEFDDLTAMKLALNMVRPSLVSRHLEITDVLNYANTHMFNDTNPNARHFLFVFTNGNFSIVNTTKLQQVKTSLRRSAITVYSIGSGDDVHMDGLSSIVNDAYNVLITHLDENYPLAILETIQSQFVYDVCDLKGE